MELKPINQQVVVVVGASTGIGRAAARRFAERGASVVVAARNQHALDSLVSEIQRKGGKAVSVVADVAHADQVQHVADRAVAEFGRIDTWAHVAGVYVSATVDETRSEEYRRVVDVNLLGAIHGARAALPHLRAAGGGALVVVSSVEGMVSLPFSSAYAASKHGVVGFLDALRLELHREGRHIAVVNVMPSAINTPLFAAALTRLGVEPRGPAPVYEPEIVADAIVRAAELPSRDVVVGGGGALLILAQRLAPRLADQILLGRIGFEAQLTGKRKSPGAPNNLYAPLPHERPRVHGDLGADAARTSLYTRLETSSAARLAREATRPLRRLAARAIEGLWAVRYGKTAKVTKAEPRPGGGLPTPVQEEMEREAHARHEEGAQKTHKPHEARAHRAHKK